MITKEQEKWLAHLSDGDSIKVVPYDPTIPQKFKKLKRLICENLGQVEVIHRGATNLGISGQGELDIYIPVEPSKFNSFIEPLTELFGEAGTVYPLERARFVTHINGTKAEVFLINKDSQGWRDGLEFESFLKANPKSLRYYEKLKEEANGLSTRKYYRRKIEFINKILGTRSKLAR